MEILSDTTFKGGLTIDNGGLTVKNGKIELGSHFVIDPNNGVSEFSVYINGNTIKARALETNAIVLNQRVGGFMVCGCFHHFQKKTGVIALMTDITSAVNSLKCTLQVKQKVMNITADADCTLFAVDIGDTVNTVINRFVKKYYTDSSSCRLIPANCFWENTDIDIFQSTKYQTNTNAGSTFVIRKEAGMEFPDAKTYPKEFYQLVVTYL